MNNLFKLAIGEDEGTDDQFVVMYLQESKYYETLIANRIDRYGGFEWSPDHVVRFFDKNNNEVEQPKFWVEVEDLDLEKASKELDDKIKYHNV